MNVISHVIKMPDLGEGIAEVELVAWHVKPGDMVAEDQILADVMTDKATVEIPSHVAGRVEALGGEVGQTMAVGSELIRIASTDGAAAPPERAKASALPAPPVAQLQVPSPPSAPLQSPLPLPVPTPKRAEAPASVRPPEPLPVPQRRPIASPALRERAWSLGVDLTHVPGTGPAGRIMQRDLDEFIARHGAPGRPASAPLAPAAAEPPPVRARVAVGGDVTEQIKFVGLRRKIAQRMQEAKRRIPHFSYVEELDVTELEALRERLNARHGAARGKLTLLPFLVRAMVVALHDFPDLNARFDDEAGVLTRHAAVHLGIATQTEAGLMVPVLRDAQAHDLWGNASEITRLAEAARSGRVVRDELSGSTITITSLGKLGGIVTTPVINMPEVAIVGVNRIIEKPVIRSGAVVPRLTMNLSSSFDHRVVDGMQAAAFVQRLRELLETPGLLFAE
ncbi:dihydrolipoamide acetyltransferase family protein [Ideonella sp. YS5]|uniref:dihydrolipoamide acetyltransferase family protein n=1 Tax=Ideonella sp. YS5 TaxID=3453714 RepID=UPI003EEF337F